MTSKNDNGMDSGVAFVGITLAVVGLFLFAVLAFIAAVYTAVALVAMYRPVRLWKWIVYPKKARLFLAACQLGALTFFVFAVFASLLFGLHIPAGLVKYIIIGGYIAGGCCVEDLIEDYHPEADAGETPAPALPPVTHEAVSSTPAPFRFASWDDEEEQE